MLPIKEFWRLPPKRTASFIVALWLVLIASASIATAAPIDEVLRMEQELTEHINQGRFSEAEKLALQMVEYARREAASMPPDIQPAMLSDLSAAYAASGNFAKAQEVSQQVVTMIEKLHGPNYYLLEQPLTNLGNAYYQQERYAEAAAVQRRALAICERHYGMNTTKVALTAENLAVTLDNWGYRAEAEPLYRRALAINLQTYGAQHATIARNAGNLGHMYFRENRYGEAEEYFNYVLSLPQQFVYPRDHIDVLRDLGKIYWLTDRLNEAETALKKALAIKQQIYGADSPFVVLDSGLGGLYIVQNRLEEAAAIDKQELAASEKVFGPESANCALRLLQVGRTTLLQGSAAEAIPYLDRCVEIFQKTGQRAEALCDAYSLRGMVAWKLGQTEKAEHDFAEAMRLADQVRTQSVGAERERAEAFSGMQKTYNNPGILYLGAGKIEAAFDCLERGRTRSLVDQMMTAHVDLLQGVPAEEAQRLRQAEGQARSDVAGLEQLLDYLPGREDLDDAARDRERSRLITELAAARNRAIEAYSAIRTASPKFREIVGKDFQPIGLPALQSWLRNKHGLMLYYAIHLGDVYLISIGGDKVHAVQLEVSEAQSKILGTSAGHLQALELERLLINADNTGVVQTIANPESTDQATGKLAALWEVLVPESDRLAILGDSIKQLVIIPDGALGLLPFEALVTKQGDTPAYLIEAEPAIDYGPSASIFHLLAERTTKAAAAAREPVLTLGDPAYGESKSPAGGGSGSAVYDTPRARYARYGGQLNRLPFSGREATWVADVFAKQGVKAAILKDTLATERMVRGNVAGRQIVHFACHGLCDQQYGNFFGALALAVDKSGKADPNDDGLLSLAEMYQLDLTGCELSILSACQTNYGEHQQGEGIWALTRGFLVAGSRRVVASNWLVDDEAAASIISYYCSLLAKELQAGRTPDYALALRDAKRWARTQEKWRHPYYWATFVLVGPN